MRLVTFFERALDFLLTGLVETGEHLGEGIGLRKLVCDAETTVQLDPRLQQRVPKV